MSKKTHKKTSKSAIARPAVAKTAARMAKPATAKPGAKSKAVTVPKSGKSSAAPAKPAAKSAHSSAAKVPQIAKAKAPAAAGLLKEGDRAPAFVLSRDGGETVSLADYAGRKLVIFFYPRADTPGCTLEAISFSRLAPDFAAAGTAVLGVSADPLQAQESFRNKHKLTVPLLSDEKLGMLNAYGVWGEKSMYGKVFMGITRTTVLIDPAGRIARIWPRVKVEGHAEDVLEVARNL